MITRPNAIINKKTGEIITQVPMPPINCLSMEGGGSRCAAFAGFYIVFKKFGLMKDVRYVAGSSGGSITALATALNMSVEDAVSTMKDLNMEKFLEGYHHWIANLSSYLSLGKTIWSVFRNQNHSLASGNAFLKWVETLVEMQLGDKNATFGDLEKRINEDVARQGYSDLKYFYVTATDITLELPERVYFSHANAKDMPIALAVRISCSIPFVFEPITWKGHVYIDGGVMENLPTNFDERRFIPPGYDFTESGLNPGMLAIKIDTQNEINQELWGIVKEVDLNSTSKVAVAVYNAGSQNTDIKQIREGRMTLALLDNNISALEFSVDEQGKLDLISSAELETIEFIQNYFHAAYEVHTYPDKIAWLKALSLDELDDVIFQYQNRLDTIQKPDYQPTPDDPTQEQLQTYLQFLNHFLTYKRLLKRNPQAEFKDEIPSFHINLKPMKREYDWGDGVKDEMERKLRGVEKQIKYSKGRINSLLSDLSELPLMTDQSYLHHPDYFSGVQALTCFHEYYKILKQERRQLAVKLGRFEPKAHYYCAEHSEHYTNFINDLNPYVIQSDKPPELKAVISDQFPILKFESNNYAKKVVFIYNLFDPDDRKIYLMAACFFLANQKSPYLEKFKALCEKHIVPGFAMPTNMSMLGKVFDLDGAKLFVCAYRIEELLHHFENAYQPKKKPGLYIDHLFGLGEYKPNKNDKPIPELQNAAEMQHMVSPETIFSAHYQSSQEASVPAKKLSSARFWRSATDAVRDRVAAATEEALSEMQPGSGLSH